MALINTKKETNKLFMIAGVVLGIIFAAASFNFIDKNAYWYPVISIVIGAALAIEAGWKQFLTSSTYKKLTGKEVINLASTGTGFVMIANGFLLIPALQSAAPTAVLAALGSISGFTAVIASILFIVHMLQK